jgi:KipI family sensor histidine kinase inhibitor
MDASAPPCLRRLGEEVLIVEFAPALTEAANRAALAFRAAVEAESWPGVVETAVTLKSALVRFDPDSLAHAELEERLRDLLASRDWRAAGLPAGRTLWRIPAAFGGEHGPQLAEVADLAGASEAALVEELAARPLRVLTIGFAPGQPYLGRLPERWDVPRRTTLTPQVPRGAVVAAIRQIVLFTVATQTGWRQIGLSAFEGFRPTAERPFPLSVGDEVAFEPVTAAELSRWQTRAADGEIAARPEPLS